MVFVGPAIRCPPKASRPPARSNSPAARVVARLSKYLSQVMGTSPSVGSDQITPSQEHQPTRPRFVAAEPILSLPGPGGPPTGAAFAPPGGDAGRWSNRTVTRSQSALLAAARK